MYANVTTHTIESSLWTIRQRVIMTHILRHRSSYHVTMGHTTSPMRSLHLNHRFGPTLTYLSTTRGPDDKAGITKTLSWVSFVYRDLYMHFALFFPIMSLGNVLVSLSCSTQSGLKTHSKVCLKSSPMLVTCTKYQVSYVTGWLNGKVLLTSVKWIKN